MKTVGLALALAAAVAPPPAPPAPTPTCQTLQQTVTYSEINLFSVKGTDLGYPSGLDSPNFGIGARLIGTGNVVDNNDVEGLEIFQCELLTSNLWACQFSQLTTTPGVVAALSYQGVFNIAANQGNFIIVGGAGSAQGAVGNAVAQNIDENSKSIALTLCL
jgi:hypothetical protein